MKSVSLTDRGRKREQNQDAVYSSDVAIGNLPNLFIVADGMGGHNGGDYASAHSVDIMEASVRDSSSENAEMILQDAISAANDEVFRLAHSWLHPELSGMGTTVVAAVVYGNMMKVANVGDSRLYVIGKKSIRQITVDHSLVEEMVRAGEITRDKARIHPNRNIITRAVGVTPSVRADFYEVELTSGEVVLLCSDGLTTMLEDEEIRVLVAEEKNLSEKANSLVSRANEKGGFDNISVVLFDPFEVEVDA